MNARRAALTSLVLVVTLALDGCQGCEDPPSATTGDKAVNLEMARGQLFILELGEVEVSGVSGGKEAEREFRHFVNHNQLLLWTHDKQKHVFRLGVTAPAASYGESTYSKVRGRSDSSFVRIKSHHIELVKDDGAKMQLDITAARFSVPEKGVATIDGEFDADIRGGWAITHGDTRFSGDFAGSWKGHLDDRPPEVTIVPPAKGLVSGAFDIYFDEPVTAEDIQERVILRDKKGNDMKITVEIRETDIDEYTTHLRVDTNQLLPFNERLTLAVGTGFQDLVGNKLARPKVEVVNTPDYPPLMNNVGHDFDAARTEPEFLLQGQIEFVDEYLGVKPYSGRLLKIEPPVSGARFSSALVARMRVAGDAKWLQVRALKIAHTRGSPTPCLRYVVASITGVLHKVECGPTDVPRGKLVVDGDEEQFTTQWIHLDIDVTGHRGHEIIVVIEARPLDPKTPPDMLPRFLVDMVRTVWEGEDPKVITGDLKLQ